MLASRAAALEGSHQQYLSAREAGAYLGLSPSYLAQMRRADRGPRFTRIGLQVRYSRDDLEAWMRSQPSGGEQPPAVAAGI